MAGPFLEDSPAPAHLLLPAQFRNDLRGYTKGGEISPEWRPTEFWRLRGSYSYLHMNLDQGARIRMTSAPRPVIDGSSPQHQVTINPHSTS